MADLGKFKERDYQILKSLIGEERAKKYFENGEYPMKQIFYVILIESIKKYARKQSFLFFIVIVLVVFIIWKSSQ